MAGDRGFGIDDQAVDRLVADLIACHNLGTQLGVVVGGGNLLRGSQMDAMKFSRPVADSMGMMATVMNALVLEEAITRAGVGARSMSALAMPQVCETYERRRALRHFDEGKIVVFGGGTGNPFFTTDTTAALRALEIGAECILMAKNGVEGVLDADPRVVPDARLIPRISHMQAIERGLRVMDTTALTLCMDNGLPIFVFNMGDERNIDRLLEGEHIGTMVVTEPGG